MQCITSHFQFIENGLFNRQMLKHIIRTCWRYHRIRIEESDNCGPLPAEPNGTSVQAKNYLLLPVIGTHVAFQGVKVNVMRNSRRAMITQHTLHDASVALELAV